MRKNLVLRSRPIRIVALLLATAALAVPSLSTSAEARPRQHRGHRDHGHRDHGSYRDRDHGHRGHGNGHRAHARFVVPVVIGAPQVRVYRPYYQGRAYFRAHHHYHAVYQFPVYGDAGYFYRPYTYCGGELFHVRAGHHGYATYDGPRFSIGVGF